MPRPPREQEPGGLYHVTAKAVADQPLFLDCVDRRRFLDLLGAVRKTHSWRCYAYCLMTTHFHILIRIEKANLSDGMQRLNGDYGRRFNGRHGSEGHRFHRRFCSVAVKDDRHLLEASRYIILNPVRAGIVRDPGSWPWSSYGATAGLVRAPTFLESAWVLGCFAKDKERAVRQYVRFIREGMDT